VVKRRFGPDTGCDRIGGKLAPTLDTDASLRRSERRRSARAGDCCTAQAPATRRAPRADSADPGQHAGAARVTTAALAAKLEVSEAALYRHFASKAQMFEGLIEFIETSIFTLLNQIIEREGGGVVQAQKIVSVLLQFGERNPGMTRVMVGDALVYENERLQNRMNQFFDRIESSLRQVLRAAAEASGSATPTVDANAQASVLVSFIIGRLQRYARSGFKRLPGEQLDAALRMLAS
jgi:TetR/AcrR family transcriptional regulator